MSDYNKIQYSFFAVGDQVVFRADTGEDIEEAAESFAKHAGGFTKAVNVIKQALVAGGVFSGDSAKKGAEAQSKPRAADTPPPVTALSSDDVAPTCKHGPMTDLRHKDYKYDFYCTLKTDNWKDKCRPVKL